MSEPARTIQALYDAFAKGDIPTVLGALTETTTWTEADGFPYAGTYVGPAAILEGVFKRLGTEWEGWTAVPDELVAEGDTVVALGEYRGTYRATGKSIAAPFVHVWKLKGPQVTSFRQVTDTVLVQRALG